MLKQNRLSPRNTHTVVLQSKAAMRAKGSEYGVKQSVSIGSRGSPSSYAEPVVLALSRPPDRRQQVPVSYPNDEVEREVDLLVRFGVDSMAGRMVARVLLVLMLLQPVYVALGMELDLSTDSEQQTVVDEAENIGAIEESASSEVEQISSDPESEPTLEANGDPEPVENSGSVDINHDTETAGGGDTEQVSGSDERVESEGGESSEDMGVDGDDATTGDDETATSTETGSTASSTDNNTKATSTDAGDTDTDDDTSATSTDAHATSTDETASTTDEELEPGVPVVQNATNKYVFADGDCTLVADGEFYCVAAGIERQVEGDARVYAEKDREGDREIFYFDGVEVKRITNNAYDDFAPVFDEETGRIVWQAMISDRLQIMLFELETNTTRQITTSRQNSSNPDILGDTVVWQEWVDTNWEVMMTNVDNDGAAFEVERLTDNMVHDMFPQIYDDLITWQSERGSSWEVVVYNQHTGKRHTLEKNEDTKYENPRFVLLFDSKHDNGDVETIGYDLDTGKMMELGTKANPQPVEPASPKDETQDALPRTGTSTLELKPVREEGNTDTVL